MHRINEKFLEILYRRTGLKAKRPTDNSLKDLVFFPALSLVKEKSR